MKQILATQFAEGDNVFLSSKNIRTAQILRKLDWKNLGPFSIKRLISTHAYELKHTKTVKLDPFFQVSLLEPSAVDLLPRQRNILLPPVTIDDNPKYQIEEIIYSKVVYTCFKYYLK